MTTALLMVESIDCDRKLVAACEAETVCRRATGFFTHVELFFLFSFLFFCFFVYYFFPTVEWEWMKFSIHSFHSGFLVIHSHSVPFHSILVHPYQIRLHNFSIQPYATPGTRLTYKIQCLSEAKSNIDHSISEERNRKKLNKIKKLKKLKKQTKPLTRSCRSSLSTIDISILIPIESDKA